MSDQDRNCFVGSDCNHLKSARSCALTLACCFVRFMAFTGAVFLVVANASHSALAQATVAPRQSLPNVVIILADDLGYADVSCYGSAGKIATPHIDQLAHQGMRFTDAHTPSSVCTPTRYGLLTGRYSWRTRLQSSVLLGYDAPLIEPDRQTMASVLSGAGYRTACFGKWHLGLTWHDSTGTPITARTKPWEVDYSKPFSGGPSELGFDRFFGISASLDMPPYVYLQDDHCLELPTTEKTWIRTGPASESFEAIDVLPRLSREACDFIESCAQDESDEPFLLYLPLAAPHTPILPTESWQGRSGINAYADFTMQVDSVVGEVMQTLEANSLTENTLVIFTSDNGCSPQANLAELRAAGHEPSGIYRGHKADIYEGGHRVPFIVSWPARVTADTTCDQLVSLIDITATLAEIAQVELSDATAVDSFSFLKPLTGEVDSEIRPSLVMHSIQGAFAIRRGDWKLCLCPGSGGWSAPTPGKEPADAPRRQLFHLGDDPGEQNNLIDTHGPIADELQRELEEIVARGRSTLGPEQSNDVEVNPHRGE